MQDLQNFIPEIVMSTQKSTLPIHISPFSFTFVHTIRCLSLDGFTVHIWNDKENRKKNRGRKKKIEGKEEKKGSTKRKIQPCFIYVQSKLKL